MKRIALVLFLSLATACSGTDAPADHDMGGDHGDAGHQQGTNNGINNGGSPDGGSVDPTDAGSVAVPLAGFGDISGLCGELDTELTASESFVFRNAIDFAMDPYDDADADRLTEGGREIIENGNAGGSSLFSEVFAYEVLQRCELAVLLKTETEVVYTDANSKLTDMLVEIDGLKVGVSVTRAVGFPREDPYTVERATELLEDKLGDIAISSANVSAEDRWTKQILHVIAYAPGHADSIETAYAGLSADVKGDTIVWVTVSDGDDEFLY